MEGLSLVGSSNRMANIAKQKEEKRAQERKRHLLYLIAEYLREQGFFEACEAVHKEARLSTDIEICDNIDLDTILLEYTEYFFAKFNKFPKICKKGESNLMNIACKKEKHNKNFNLTKSNQNRSENDCHSVNLPEEKLKCNDSLKSEPNLNITITPLFPNGNNLNKNVVKDQEYTSEKYLKPLGTLYPPGSDWRDIAEMINKEIVLYDLKIHWNDVKGLDACKNLLKEAAVYPLKYPEMFNQRLTPWKGVLLYGPPGTGKTMLAKAVATECRATFFNITSSSLVSKWRGESEKYVRVLLDLAKYYAPSIIFIDEIDWTVSGGVNEISNNKSEPSRRFRAELLARLDGLLSMENTNVLLLAATNIPWELDTALLRRLEKRIYVDLPDEDARNEIFKIYLKPDIIKKADYSAILKKTDGYSCADLKLLCKEAWMMQLRPIWAHLESGKCSSYINDEGITDLKYIKKAIDVIRPISQNIQWKYDNWNKSFYSRPIKCSENSVVDNEIIIKENVIKQNVNKTP